MTTEAEERAEAIRQTWQYRCVAATQGNSSLLGCILLSVIGRNARHPPWIESGVTIDADGVCYVNFVDKTYTEYVNAPICVVEDLINNFKGLADTLKLSDADRVALFDELRKWVVKDMRIVTDELRRN